MKKNLMIVMLLLSVVLASFVISASVTGYLVSRGAVSTEGVTATLQRVDAGVATVEVTTSEGDTQVVKITKGQPAQVGDAQISVSNLKSGTLFRRSTANVEIDLSKEASAVAKIATGLKSLGNQTNCTIPWLNQTGNFTLSLNSSAGNFTINASGVYAWAPQKGFKFATDGKLRMDLQETTKNSRKWVCNRGWLDTAWLCNVFTI